MKQLRIFYFSATGNTKRAARILAESCASAGIAVETLALLDSPTAGLASPSPETGTLIAFPALGFGAPDIVLKRVRSLPAGEGSAALALEVCGAEMRRGAAVSGWPGSGLEQVESILRRKGYEVAHTGYVSYPSNWTQMAAPAEGEDRERLLASGDEETRKFASAAIAGEKSLYRCGRGNRIWTAIVNWLFRAVGRRFLGKLYVADASCTGCGACAGTCPVGAIRMRRSLPSWRLACEDCNRCINVCPVRAIQVSAAKIVLYSLASIACYAAAFWAGIRFLGDAAPGLGGAARAAAMLVLAVALAPIVVALIAGPLDALVALASRVPSVGRLFSRGHTSRFGRYREPGFRP